MKEQERKRKMKNQSQLAAFIITGVAVGAAAWWLFGTKEGRRQMDCAADNMRDIANSLRQKAKEGAVKAADLAGKAREEAQHLQDKARVGIGNLSEKLSSNGKAVAEKAGDTVKKVADKAQKAAKKVAHQV